MMKQYGVMLLVTALILPTLVMPAQAQQSDDRRTPQSRLTQSTRKSQADSRAGQPIVTRAAKFAVSTPVRDLPPARPEPGKDASIRFDTNRKLVNRDEERFFVPGRKASPDGALQRYSAPTGAADAPDVPLPPTVQFEGLSNQDNFNAFGGRVNPPDTVGDVGPNHYVQMTNLMFRIWDKAGTPLTAPAKVSSLFAPLGPPCGNRDDGDPIVVYDDLADRWLLSQFCLPGGSSTPPFHELIAISQTSDPTGAYYLYDFITPGNKFQDYPKFGVWPDGYYMTAPQFPSTGGFGGIGVFAFDRAKMLVGDPAAFFIYFDAPSLPITNIGNATRMLPANVDGLVPPPPGAPAYIVNFAADEYGDPADAIRIFEFHADFAVPSNSTFTERAGSPLPVASFDPTLKEVDTSSTDTVRDDIEQPAPAPADAKLDSLSNRPMMQLQYRNFGSYESLVFNHTVDVNSTAPSATTGHRAGIRYYQLRRNFSGGNFTVPEQATFAGVVGDTDHRWMGSAAMNWQGDLAVGYSISGPSTYPGIRYAGRLAGDPPNGLTQGEQVLIAGSGVQTSTGSRWGDYSTMSVDPTDDCSFWYTQEYYTAAGQASSSVGWQTRIGKFNLGACTTSPRGTIQGTVTNSETGLPVAGAVVKTTNGYTRVTDASGHYSITPIAPGSYTMTAAKRGFMPSTAPGVAVANGGSTIQNFVLAPGAEIALGSATVTERAFSNGNGQVEPGESGQLVIQLSNPGNATATNVQATLTVLDPPAGLTLANSGGPINFGDIPVSGSATNAATPFRFFVSNSVSVGTKLRFVITVSFGNGTSPVAFQFEYLFGQAVIEPPITTTLDTNPPPSGGNFTSTTGQQTGRLNRFSPPSSCGTQKANPGLFETAGARQYDAYRFTNTSSFTQCVTVNVTGNISTNLYSAAYNNAGFVPSNPSLNFLGDAATSSSNMIYSFDVPSGQSFTVVVHEVNTGGGSGLSYTLNISRVNYNPGPTLSISDVYVTEGNTGTTNADFTVTLLGAGSQPVPINFATADGTATAGTDYQATSNTVTFNPGEQTKTITVPVNGDTTPELNETFFVNLSDPDGFLITADRGVGTILNDDAPVPYNLLISEFRFRGSAGSLDEFIELYNNTDSPMTVSTIDGSSGWSLLASDGAVRFTIPNGTVIPARGHFLATNNSSGGYSLSTYPAGNGTTATPDITYSTNIPDNAGIALFRTSNANNFTAANVLDAVGFAGISAPYFEGTPLPAIGTTSGQYSFVRKTITAAGVPNTGRPQDNNNNAADFVFVSTTGGTFGGVQSVLGAPGPENLSSPIQRNAQIRATLVDPAAGVADPRNRARLSCDNPGAPACSQVDPNTSTAGYLAIRRTYTNNTGASITRLRFRIVDITAGTAPAGTADVRAVNSPNATVTRLDGSTVTVEGTTLETPPTQSNGGGLNSTLSVGTITMGSPLGSTAPNNKVNVQFLLGIKAVGNFRFLVNVEALP